MVASLTGYGRAELLDESGRVCVECKSVNNRFLQLDLHIPYGYGWLEERLRGLVGERVSRGKLIVNLEIFNFSSGQDIMINEPLLQRLVELQNKLALATGQRLNLNLDGLLSLPGAMKVTASMDEERFWNRLKPVIEKALNTFSDARRREGENLARDMRGRQKALLERLAVIEERLPTYREHFKTQFTNRLRELNEQAGLDESRLATEIALWVDRTDVTEEITRLRSHLPELDSILSRKDSIGRRLDFLLQEIHRETNTLGNKLGDLAIIQQVLEMKCEIEKIREQAQNLE
ncbi:MAG TPA: YicC family protein [Candidatus Ozemobacteraceae bacterium]|nr:YicC family protein [Candidatus Ozemobacteraceae bacterium]